MGTLVKTKAKWLKRKKRISKGLKSSTDRPRLSVFRSSKHIYAQIIDDASGRTLVCASSVEKNIIGEMRFESKVALADFIGKTLAERAIKEGLEKVVFDRNGFFYHGRVKALSEGARKAGLDF